MKNIRTAISRHLHGLAALLLLGAAVAPAFLQTAATAAGQVTTRSIQLSNSAASGSTQLKIAFTPATAAQELVVEFCSDTPFPGAACSFNSATVPTVGASPTASAGTITQLSGGTPAHAFKITGLTISGSFNVTVLTGITNPSTANATFYARIYTYGTGGSSTYTEASTSGNAPTGVGTPTDTGGIALSTASTIAITAQVMESLSFCVYLGTSTCGVQAPTFFLGHSTNNILDTSVVDTKTVKFDLSTNALSGAVVRLTGDTLKSGANSITAAGNTLVTINPGDGKFGLAVTAAGGLTIPAKYSSATQYALDTTQTTSTFGDQLASSASVVNGATTTITYAATAATTTPAGIYTANHQLIATGTF